MNVVTLKKKIKAKFGTIVNFTKVAKVDPYELQKKFTNINWYLSKGQNSKAQVMIAGINSAVDKARVPKLSGEIPIQKIKLLRTHVMHSGGVLTFCRNNPEFKTVSVFQILQGRRRKMSPIVVKLFKHFDI